jgi:hypothetical protein
MKNQIKKSKYRVWKPKVSRGGAVAIKAWFIVQWILERRCTIAPERKFVLRIMVIYNQV